MTKHGHHGPSVLGIAFWLVSKAVELTVKTALYSLYGAWQLVVGAAHVRHRLADTRRLLQDTLTCTSCGFANSTVSRWTCQKCSGTYQGFVGECTLCGASASHYACERCHCSIVLARTW